jgi:hypothetical protein
VIRTLKVVKFILLTVGIIFFLDWGFTSGQGNYSNPAPYAIIALTMVGGLSCHILIAWLVNEKLHFGDFGLMIPAFTLVGGSYYFLVYVCHLPSEPFVLMFWVGWFVVILGFPKSANFMWRSGDPTADPDEDSDEGLDEDPAESPDEDPTDDPDAE